MEDNTGSAMLMHVPYKLIEALNGIMGGILFWMLVFLAWHLTGVIKNSRKKYGHGHSWLKTACKIYNDNMPEVAMLTFTAALFCRNGILWYVRFLRDHHLREEDWVTLNAPWLLVVTSGVFVVGVCCFIRVILPMDNASALKVWTVMVGSSLLFGIGMAMANF